MPLNPVFDPNVNGWMFSNWGEDVEFTWDLYRDTYLGINPTQNCVEASLDCAFFEIFKNCAQNGNCGGMSVLALALFKYGSYMGFCSPASFYTGGESPDRADLHRAINLLQARQFSVSGIECFIDATASSNLNDAVNAYNVSQACWAQGDYAVLWIAKGALGTDAHTVIPYKWTTSGGTRYMDIWNSNLPADDYPSHYGSSAARMVINGPQNWTYDPFPGDPANTPYLGSDHGWCFALPMSKLIIKDRQPMTLDMAFDALQTVFLSGPGAAISQVSDGRGRSYYTADSGAHLDRGDIETDPAKRLPGMVRWPWPSQGEGKSHHEELYFIRGRGGKADLDFSLRGKTYKFTHLRNKYIFELEVAADRPVRDVVHFAEPSPDGVQTVELRPAGNSRVVSLQVHKMGPEPGAWRKLEIKEARLTTSALKVDLFGDLDEVELSGPGKQVEAKVALHERRNRKVTTQEAGKVILAPRKPFRADLKKIKK
jgi:hypothetical protein